MYFVYAFKMSANIIIYSY